MRKLIVTVLILLAAGFVAAAKMKAHVGYDKNVDFGAIKTFDYRDTLAASVVDKAPPVHEMIKLLIIEKLQEQESIEYFQKAIAADPDFAMAYLDLALVEPTNRGFFEQLDKAMALVDEVTAGERLQILGIRAIADADPKRQTELYEKLVRNYPNDERAHNLLANNYFGQQEYPPAIAEFEEAVRLNPEFSQPYNQLGYAYRFLGKYEAAEKAFQKYIELIPNDPNPYDSYADLLTRMGKYDAAIEQFEKALAQDSQFVPSRLGIASNLVLKGDYEAARTILDQAYDMARHDGERRAALFAKAITYVDQGDYDQAIAELNMQHALAMANNDVPAMAADLGTMGRIYFEQGKYDEAMAMYEQAEQILVEEAPILPLAYGRDHVLIKPWVQSLPASGINGNILKDIIIEPH